MIHTYVVAMFIAWGFTIDAWWKWVILGCIVLFAISRFARIGSEAIHKADEKDAKTPPQ